MQDKKGFTVLELLMCLWLVSCMLLVTIPLTKSYEFQCERFVLDALMVQCEALAKKQKQHFSHSDIQIHYSATGNVDHADTLVFKDKVLTLQLGWGKLIEK